MVWHENGTHKKGNNRRLLRVGSKTVAHTQKGTVDMLRAVKSGLFPVLSQIFPAPFLLHLFLSQVPEPNRKRNTFF